MASGDLDLTRLREEIRAWTAAQAERQQRIDTLLERIAKALEDLLARRTTS